MNTVTTKKTVEKQVQKTTTSSTPTLSSEKNSANQTQVGLAHCFGKKKCFICKNKVTKENQYNYKSIGQFSGKFFFDRELLYQYIDKKFNRKKPDDFNFCLVEKKSEYFVLVFNLYMHEEKMGIELFVNRKQIIQFLIKNIMKVLKNYIFLEESIGYIFSDKEYFDGTEGIEDVHLFFPNIIVNSNHCKVIRQKLIELLLSTKEYEFTEEILNKTIDDSIYCGANLRLLYQPNNGFYYKINKEMSTYHVPNKIIDELRAVSLCKDSADINWIPILDKYGCPIIDSDYIKYIKKDDIQKTNNNKHNLNLIGELVENLDKKRFDDYHLRTRFISMCAYEGLNDMAHMISQTRLGYKKEKVNKLLTKKKDSQDFTIHSLYKWSHDDNPDDHIKIIDKFSKNIIPNIDNSENILKDEDDIVTKNNISVKAKNGTILLSSLTQKSVPNIQDISKDVNKQKILIDIASLYKTDQFDEKVPILLKQLIFQQKMETDHIICYLSEEFKKNFILRLGDIGHTYCYRNDSFNYYGNDVYKLGCTKDIKKRLASYITSYLHPGKYELVSNELCDNRLAELILFDILREFRIVKNREFFRCDLSIIKNAFENVEKIFIEHKNDTTDIIKHYFPKIFDAELVKFIKSIIAMLRDNDLIIISDKEVVSSFNRIKIRNVVRTKNKYKECINTTSTSNCSTENNYIKILVSDEKSIDFFRQISPHDYDIKKDRAIRFIDYVEKKLNMSRLEFMDRNVSSKDVELIRDLLSKNDELLDYLSMPNGVMRRTQYKKEKIQSLSVICIKKLLAKAYNIICADLIVMSLYRKCCINGKKRSIYNFCMSQSTITEMIELLKTDGYDENCLCKYLRDYFGKK